MGHQHMILKEEVAGHKISEFHVDYRQTAVDSTLYGGSDVLSDLLLHITCSETVLVKK
jgi:hypothetical protein